jgi:hypothetical protein
MLATNGASAASRFNLTGAHWVRVDGAAITATAAGLFNAALLDTGINVTADGQTYLGNYLQWTGAGGGSLNGTSASSCVNWTASTATSSGQTGVVGRTNTSVMSGTGMFACNIGYAKITCLQE